MHPILNKTFGGLSRAYYLRQLIFSAIFPVAIGALTVSKGGLTAGLVAYMAINTLLYPYARFVYESVVGFILGSNTFFVNALTLLFAKLMTMLLCWCFAMVIAPIGLAYLYWHHSRVTE